MSLLQRIEEDYRSALKQRDTLTCDVLRMVKSALKNLQIEKGRTLEEEEILQAISREVKKRKESIAEYEKSQRLDLKEKEEKELAILYRYLPEQLSDEQLLTIIREVAEKIQPEGMKDFGKMMKEVMARVKGKAEGSKVSELVRSFLFAQPS
ncbi:MAG: GatB/YqeY domain-containing protein [bacterium JZ-2024 1]